MKMKNIQCFGYERKIGRTPNGGKYAEIYYYNECNFACAKEEATHCIIFERKSNGKLVGTIHCSL